MKCGYGVTVASDASSVEEWFNSTAPLKLYPNFPSSEAMKFRKRYAKGWITPGACNLYVGVGTGNNLFGILGFQAPTYGNYDILLKADTTPSQWAGSNELLLYALKSKEVQNILCDRFTRQIDTAYSKCFSRHPVISRYRKFADQLSKEEKRINKNTFTKSQKVAARAKIARDLKSGKIQKGPCEICGATYYVEAHHPNYSKPDIFHWLCTKHHDEAYGRDGTCYEIIGYDLGYLFQLGTWTLKEGKNRFVQKHGSRI